MSEYTVSGYILSNRVKSNLGSCIYCIVFDVSNRFVDYYTALYISVCLKLQLALSQPRIPMCVLHRHVSGDCLCFF